MHYCQHGIPKSDPSAIFAKKLDLPPRFIVQFFDRGIFELRSSGHFFSGKTILLLAEQICSLKRMADHHQSFDDVMDFLLFALNNLHP